MKKLLVFALCFCCSTLLWAEAFHGQQRPFQQPDGSMVDVKLYGNEYYIRAEGLDGYTLIRDKKTSWICYANLNADGSALVSTGIVYRINATNFETQKQALPFEKHLDITAQAREAIVYQNKLAMGDLYYDPATQKMVDNGVDKSLRSTPVLEVSGYIKGLCIVVDFPDEPGTLPLTEFDDFCNSLTYSNYGNNGSLRKYYQDISGGLLDYENVVVGYYHAPLTFAQYDDMPYTMGAKLVLGQALHWLDSLGFDFSTLSTNPDGTIRAINLMYTGNPPNWAQGMWFHKGTFTAFSADGVSTRDYNCSPASAPLGIGVVCHENGHMIGKWPDTYKYDNMHGNDGLDAFDLMCWYGTATNPVPPNPLFRSNVGWGRVVDVTGYNGINSDTANSSTCYKYVNINDTTEFFLLESRLKTGRSTYIDDQGLTIWHIDRNGDNQSWHHEVYLEHASNDYTDHAHACFKSGFNDEFGASTLPASTFYNGDASGLRVWEIGTVGAVMQYKLGLGAPGPSLKILYDSTGSDDNGNGSIEAGESALITVSGLNFGQNDSDTAVLTCTAIGANAGYVTVNTAPIALGIVHMGDTLPAVFSFTVAPGTPLGTVLQLQFTITDGVSTYTYTREVEVGFVLPLNNNLNDTLCEAIFYDMGITGDYGPGLDYTKTVYPSSPGQSIRAEFLEFDLEYNFTCSADYLMIYDGPSTTSTILGTFCSNFSVGPFVSSDPSGALTFVFHSNGGTQAAGWKALLTCASGVGIHENATPSAAKVYPNPSTGMINITLPNASNVGITVTDLTGRVVFNAQFAAQKQIGIDLSDKTNGLYLVTLKLGNEVQTQRVVVQR